MNTAFWFFVLVVGGRGAFAEKEHASVEITSEDQQSFNPEDDPLDIESLDLGPPDSHEAMNNREVNPRNIREKRSYEFLMGLINNNSKYEVVKAVESPSSAGKSKKNSSDNSNGTELLLRLIMKIATHPDQWNRVHQMLQNLDKDLVASRNIVTTIKEKSNNKTQRTRDEELYSSSSENDTYILGRQNMIGTTERSWPVFGNEQPLTTDNTSYVQNRTERTNDFDVRTETTKIYQKNFTYRRVTGKPAYLKRNPTAYIAVSAMSPKTTFSRYQANEDLTLEKELHRLKPWPSKSNT